MSAGTSMGARKAPRPLAANKMRNAARPNLTVLVEGGGDKRFWQAYLPALLPPNTLDFRIEHMEQGGRSAVLAKLDQAQTHLDAVMLGIVDADLDRILQTLPACANVIFTDAHDLETTLLELPALEKLLSVQLDPSERAAAEERWNETFRARLFRHGEGAGKLRWLNQQDNSLDLKFRKVQKNVLVYVEHSKGVDPDWSPSIQAFMEVVINFSQQMTLKSRIPELVNRCTALPEVAQEQLCNGHDLIGFLRAGLYEVSGKKLTHEELTDQLFFAVERVWLEQTDMWKCLAKHCSQLLSRFKPPALAEGVPASNP